MSLDASIGLQLGSLDLDVELSVEPGEVVAILGPNGSGKSTVLRALAGLVPIDRGRISIDDFVLDDPAADVFVPVEQRPIGFVFQDYLLFAHLSAVENVAFGLRARGVPKVERAAARQRVAGSGRTVGPRVTPATGLVGWSGATGRTGASAGDRPAAVAPRRAARGARCRNPSRCSPRPATTSRVVRRDAAAGHPRSRRRLRARRSSSDPRRRQGRPDRNDRRGHRSSTIALRRRPGRHQPRRRHRHQRRADHRQPALVS